jgi:hypothetical protein
MSLILGLFWGQNREELGQLGLSPCPCSQQPPSQAWAHAPLTESTSSFEQKKQTQRKTFIVFTRKPT